MQSIVRFIRLIAASLALAAILPASASFHLWTMTQLYSSADGTVQFLELQALTGGQEFVAGHTLKSTSGGTTHTYNITTNLVGDSANHKLLIATQGFADLHVVTPDYIVPNGFFFPAGGTVNWGEGADVWNHGALPAPPAALNRDGTTGTNAATNYAGTTGSAGATTTPPTTLNFQALWWKSPANSEAGWGINITHQGDILFATWFTYDAGGNPLWLVMSNGAKVGDNHYAGALYQTTGAPFNNYDASRFQFTPVGTADFTFSDANNGVFTYTFGGVTQSKAITRQVYSSPVSTCASGGTASFNFQDLWWNSPANSEAGWGVNITHQGNILFATWFTYGADGKGVWYVVSNGARVPDSSTDIYGMAMYTGYTYTGPLYQTSGAPFSNYDPSKFTFTQVGTATFDFSSPNLGTFTYTVNGVTQTKTITRQVYSTTTTCH